MDERIEGIRRLLGELESEIRTDDDQQFILNFDALELPGLVSSIIEFLQPTLRPYEAAVYWHMFGLSILRSGQQYCRVSTRGLMTGVVLSASGNSQAQTLGLSTTRDTLRGLESKGIIVQMGEPNREGTLYKVLLPEEIESCREAMKKKGEQPATPQINVAKEADFYNVAENRLRVFERDDYHCYYCRKQLTRFTATLDHLQPVSKGGDNSLENLITACLHCNSRRTNRPVMDMLSETKAGEET